MFLPVPTHKPLDQPTTTNFAGALLISNVDGGDGVTDPTKKPHVPGRERVVVTGQATGNRIRESPGALGQLGSEITNWLAERGQLENDSGSVAEVYSTENVRENSGVMMARFTGHRNTRTILKEAAFWDDRYVLSGLN